VENSAFYTSPAATDCRHHGGVVHSDTYIIHTGWIFFFNIFTFCFSVFTDRYPVQAPLVAGYVRKPGYSGFSHVAYVEK
jgi:hypothetical protein